MTFLELYGTALDRELSTADRTNLFTTVRRQQAVNDAQRDFARLTSCAKRYGTIAIVDGTAEYDLYTGIADFLDLAGDPSIRIISGSDTRYIQGLDAFPESNPEEMDRLQPGWRAVDDGTPTTWYLREDGAAYYLGMNPGPAISGSDVWAWVVPYIPEVVDMSADADEPFSFSGAPMRRLRDYHQALVHYAAAQLVLLRKDTTEHLRQMQLYSGLVAQYLQQQRERSQDQITLARSYFGERRGGERGIDIRR